MEPARVQLKGLYRLCHYLTNVVFQLIHIVRLDERTGNLFVLARHNEEIEFEVEIKPPGEYLDESD
jgi:hypothetical protein